MKQSLITAIGVVILAAVPMTVSAQDTTPTSISFVHGIPDVVVDVVVDGEVLFDDVAYGTISDLTSSAGTTLADFEIVDTATDSLVVGPTSLSVPADGNWSLAVHLDVDGVPTLTSFQNDVSASDSARVTVRHEAEAGPVDVVIGTDRPVTNLANGQSSTLDLPPGQLAGAELAPAGTDPILAIPTVDLAASTNTIIHVFGSGLDDTLGFVTQVVPLDTAATTTTTVASSSATSTTTTTPGSTTTTTTSTTTTVAALPTAVGTGAPIDDDRTTLLLVIVAGLALAGGSMLVRRRL